MINVMVPAAYGKHKFHEITLNIPRSATVLFCRDFFFHGVHQFPYILSVDIAPNSQNTEQKRYKKRSHIFIRPSYIE